MKKAGFIVFILILTVSWFLADAIDSSDDSSCTDDQENTASANNREPLTTFTAALTGQGATNNEPVTTESNGLRDSNSERVKTAPNDNNATKNGFTTEPNDNSEANNGITTEPNANSATNNGVTTEPNGNSEAKNGVTTKSNANSATNNGVTTEPNDNGRANNEIATPMDPNRECVAPESIGSTPSNVGRGTPVPALRSFLLESTTRVLAFVFRVVGAIGLSLGCLVFLALHVIGSFSLSVLGSLALWFLEYGQNNRRSSPRIRRRRRPSIHVDDHSGSCKSSDNVGASTFSTLASTPFRKNHCDFQNGDFQQTNHFDVDDDRFNERTDATGSNVDRAPEQSEPKSASHNFLSRGYNALVETTYERVTSALRDLLILGILLVLCVWVNRSAGSSDSEVALANTRASRRPSTPEYYPLSAEEFQEFPSKNCDADVGVIDIRIDAAKNTGDVQSSNPYTIVQPVSENGTCAERDRTGQPAALEAVESQPVAEQLGIQAEARHDELPQPDEPQVESQQREEPQSGATQPGVPQPETPQSS